MTKSGLEQGSTLWIVDAQDVGPEQNPITGREITAHADAASSGFVLADQPLELYRALAG